MLLPVSVRVNVVHTAGSLTVGAVVEGAAVVGTAVGAGVGALEQALQLPGLGGWLIPTATRLMQSNSSLPLFTTTFVQQLLYMCFNCFLSGFRV